MLPVLAIVAVVSGWVFIMNMVRTNQKVLTLWSQAQQLATDRQYRQAIETAGELLARRRLNARARGLSRRGGQRAG